MQERRSAPGVERGTPVPPVRGGQDQAATVGLMGEEGLLLRMTVIPMVYYCWLVGSLAFIGIYGVGFNLGTTGLIVLVATLASVLVWIRRRDAAIGPGPGSGGPADREARVTRTP
jgi:hypothetical protein